MSICLFLRQAMNKFKPVSLKNIFDNEKVLSFCKYGFKISIIIILPTIVISLIYLYSSPQIERTINIVQALVIIIISIFTAGWTFRTFAFKEKIGELKQLRLMIDMYYQNIKMFCGQIRENISPDAKEIQERLGLATIHNKLVELSKLNYYINPEVRETIQSIVGLWLIKKIDIMQNRKNSKWKKEERERAWQEFNKEYKQVIDLIDGETKTTGKQLS